MLEKELDELRNKLNFYKQHQKSKISLSGLQRTLRGVYSEDRLGEWSQPSLQRNNYPRDCNHYSMLNKMLLAENN